mmetsp:Transcript_131197/g.261840  ORF Transcript_131197/g.261840 Transcript_131197/m.261840 type:complete len:575 (-) Transcript_131197:20-1744(-)
MATESPAAATGTVFGTGLGFGQKTAVIVIDFTRAYTTPGSDFFCGDANIGVVKAVRESIDVLAAARKAGVPIIYTRVVFTEGAPEGGVFVQKVPKLREWLVDNPMTEIVSEVAPQPGDTVLFKQYPSCFFGTPLASLLTSQSVDSVLLIGCSTSGCVRATATDAMSNGFRVVVCRDCVGDRVKEVHEANLFDIKAKIGDVVDKSAVLAHFESLAAASEGRAKKSKVAVPVTSDSKKLDGVCDFKVGQRDFTPSSGGNEQKLCYDFDAKTRIYTNGVEAPNRTRIIKGGLTGEEIKIPDVNSAYPLAWRGPSTDSYFDRGDGQPDFLEFKRKFGLIIPSTNTTVEYDYWRMILTEGKIPGVGFHSAGILISAPKLASDQDMLDFLTQFRREIFRTIDSVMTAEPEYIIMGMSLETFFGGWEGNKEFKKEISDRCGLSCATGAEACKYALEKFNAQSIAVITPYQEIGDKNVVKFFAEIGVTVKRIHGLKCGSATDIAHVPEVWCEQVIREKLDGPDIEAIVQCGTNLSMISVSEKLEKELGKPVIAINAATLWFALRENGFTEPIPNCTRLLREF